MLSFHTKSRYGLIALLALAESYDRGLLGLREIAEKNSIPQKYLEQIFSRLSSADIIRSVRGKNGGYSLAHPPEHITVLQAVEVLEGGLALSGDTANGDNATITSLFQDAEQALRSRLDISFADLLLRHRQNKVMFHI